MTATDTADHATNRRTSGGTGDPMIRTWRRPPLAVRAQRSAGYAALHAVLALQRARGDLGAASFFAAGRREPYRFAELVRSRGRLVPTAMGWSTAEYELAGEVLREHRRFGSADVPVERQPVVGRVLGRLLTDTPAGGQGVAPRSAWAASLPPDPFGPESILGMDPPDHTRLRRLLGRAFTPRAVERLRPTIERLTHDLLDAAARRRDGVDLVRDFAAPLPVAVIAAMLGIPDDDLDDIYEWGEALGNGLDISSPGVQERTERARVLIASYFERFVEQRRRQPGNLVIDAMIDATRPQPDGAAAGDGDPPLTERELVATATILLAAGFETTVNLLGNTVNALLLHPDQRALLRPGGVLDDRLVGNAVEESLRWDPPVQREGRRVRVATELAGVPLVRGDRVTILLSGVNRDPAVFDDPHRFDVARENASRHLSFAAGVHHCLGASLSRAEGEIALRVLLERFPDFRATGPGVRSRRLVLRGMQSLPVDLGREAG